jgi:hypothetical protein
MVGAGVGTSALPLEGFSVGLSVDSGILPVGLKTGADIPSSPSSLVG